MAVGTSNLYGNIVVNKRAIRAVAGIAALECYGVWGVGRRRTIRNVENEFRIAHGVRVWASKNKIGIYIDIAICVGISIDALVASVRKAIKYKVETYSGMEVVFVDIRVTGIRK